MRRLVSPPAGRAIRKAARRPAGHHRPAPSAPAPSVRPALVELVAKVVRCMRRRRADRARNIELAALSNEAIDRILRAE